ncbi:hypothetical protein A2U01_0077997, partial [Trifolium medium]|nr:hypothetical protein [Trifolium medium]
DENVIDVDNLNSGESPAEKTHVPSIAKGLRSTSGKIVITESEPTHITKEIRKTGKKLKYGTPRT